MNGSPTDEERYPTLTEHGRHMLRRLREHPHAPVFRNQSGNRLTSEDVARVIDFEQRTVDPPFDWDLDAEPPWLGAFVDDWFRRVPHARGLTKPSRFEDLPTTSRGDLSRDIAAFVPDDAPIERLINFRTTGTTGQPLVIASHPVVAASYLSFHKRALRRFGISLQARRGEVGVMLLGFQKKCFTYVSVTPTMDESGLVKLNLHPDDWHRPDDRAAYINDLEPEVIAGDPLSFLELLTLPLTHRPRAILSTAMTLLPGLKNALETHYQCPVLDLYSLNEAGPIAVADPRLSGHVLLQSGMFVEILDPSGVHVPQGIRGEITLTGGFNFCLPLLRYRTGDHAAMTMRDGELVLIEFEGRAPVRFRTAAGGWVNNIDLTHALASLPLGQYRIHQEVTGGVRVVFSGLAALDGEIRTALTALLGPQLPLIVTRVANFDGKVAQYTSDLLSP